MLRKTKVQQGTWAKKGMTNEMDAGVKSSGD